MDKLEKGTIHIHASFNNTIIEIKDSIGNILSCINAREYGFVGSDATSLQTSILIGKESAKTAIEKGIKIVEIYVRGSGKGRESIINSLSTNGLTITMIKDTTPVPHNGVRPPKRRRL